MRNVYIFIYIYIDLDIHIEGNIIKKYYPGESCSLQRKLHEDRVEG